MTRSSLRLAALLLVLAATACAAPTPWDRVSRETGRLIRSDRP